MNPACRGNGRKLGIRGLGLWAVLGVLVAVWSVPANVQAESPQSSDDHEEEEESAGVKTDKKKNPPSPPPQPATPKIDRHGVVRPAKGQPSRINPLVLPAGAYNPDDGVGLGAFLGMRRAMPRPRLVPGSQDEIVHPELGDRPWVWDLALIGLVFLKPYPNGWWLSGLASMFPKPDGRTEWEWNLGVYGLPWDWWFGVGNDRVRDLRRDSEDDPVSNYWHRYARYEVRTGVRIRRRAIGPLVFSGGLLFKWDDVEVLENTLLEEQVRQGLIEGTLGGPQSTVEGSIIVDSRDDPQDPTSGVHLSGVGEAIFGRLGVSGRFSLDLRGFVSPPNPVLVFAGEAIGQIHVGTVPFYELGTIGGPEIRPRTLCGVGGLRGLDRGRVRGPLSLLLHGEIRFRPPGFRVGTLGVRLEPTLFVDGTRADEFDRLGAGPVLHGSVGGGLRIILNEQLLVRLDVGTGPEAVLTDEGEENRWRVGGYAAVRHTF